LTAARHDNEAARTIIGHLARAELLSPEPSPPDRVAGRVLADWDHRTLALCRVSAREAERVRWNQYRAVWAYVEGSGCRRRALLAHFGDRSLTARSGGCCDACDGPGAAWAAPALEAAAGTSATAERRTDGGNGQPLDLDQAILDVVGSARPPVGRTRAVEILRGGRSKAIFENAYDGLAAYGAFAHLRSADVLGRVDQLLAEGSLRSSGGRFPKLRAALASAPGAARSPHAA
jgi:ATP-dependent DNA helicase RecQ